MTPRSQNGMAIGLILASVAAMAFADAVVKALSGDITLWQIFVSRSIVAAIVLMAMMRVARAPLRPKALGWAYLRGALLAATWMTYYASLPVLSLSTASVVMYLGPVLIVLFAGIGLGDHVSARQWAAVVIGFLGVLTISRPGTDAFSWAVLLPMLGAACYAAAMLLTRAKCQDDHPFSLSLALTISLLIVGVIGASVLAAIDPDPETRSIYPFILGTWVDMTPRDWAVIVLLGVLIALYGAGVAKAYQIGAASVVATFDYGYLISAALWGFILFAETPDGFTVAGMALISVAGFLAIDRDR